MTGWGVLDDFDASRYNECYLTLLHICPFGSVLASAGWSYGAFVLREGGVRGSCVVVFIVVVICCCYLVLVLYLFWLYV